MPNNTFDTWRAMQAGEEVTLSNAEPQMGYYRFRATPGAPGPWQRCAIWLDGELTGEIDGKEASPLAVWERVLADPNATSHDDYTFHFHNRHYPDEPPPSARNEPVEEVALTAVEEDPDEIVYRAIGRDADSQFSRANDLLAQPLDTVSVDAVVDLAVQMVDTATKAEARHKIEKEPFLTRGRQVDDRWSFAKTLREAAKTLRDTIVTPVLAKRAAAEKAKRDAAEAEARKAHAESVAKTPAGAAPPPPPVLPPPTPIRVSAGSGKKTIALKPVDVAKVTDRKAFCAYLLDAEHADLLALLDKVAAQMLRSKVAKGVPGLTIETADKAK